MQLVFIHGAWSSPKVFNYIIQNLTLDADPILLEYSTKEKFANNARAMYHELSGVDDVFFITHSFGGVYAAHLADALGQRCVGAVTISAPYGGVDGLGAMTLMFPSEEVFRDLNPTGKVIRGVKQSNRPSNWTQVVCASLNGGAPWIKEPNDGVVTVKSQKAIVNCQFVNFGDGHHEVLQDPQLVTLIKSKLGQ